jgi:hypothetical protein
MMHTLADTVVASSFNRFIGAEEQPTSKILALLITLKQLISTINVIDLISPSVYMHREMKSPLAYIII